MRGLTYRSAFGSRQNRIDMSFARERLPVYRAHSVVRRFNWFMNTQVMCSTAGWRLWKLIVDIFWRILHVVRHANLHLLSFNSYLYTSAWKPWLTIYRARCQETVHLKIGATTVRGSGLATPPARRPRLHLPHTWRRARLHLHHSYSWPGLGRSQT